MRTHPDIGLLQCINKPAADSLQRFDFVRNVKLRLLLR